MTAPTDTLWQYSPHSAAKHRLLRRYLDARLAIMGQKYPELVFIDGFAGPGRYLGGAKDSPLLMLDSFLEHDSGQKIRARLEYFFIEERPDRFARLTTEVAQLEPLPSQVQVHLIPGSFEDEMQRIMVSLGSSPAPIFAFIDPFGYSDTHLEVTSHILGYRGCEVLVYVPLYHIARFITSTDIEAALTNLYGDRSWERAREATTLNDRIEVLRELFKDALRKTCSHVLDMEIDDEEANSGYFLFFGTSHDLGLQRMKDAMWKLDPVYGQRFRALGASNQLCLPVEERPNLAPLMKLLRDRFGLDEFGIEEAYSLTVATRFREDGHLKSLTLRPLEARGELVVSHPGRRRPGQYPPGTRLRFKE